MKTLIFLIMLSISFSMLFMFIGTLTTTNRFVSVKSTHENGVAIINNIKYKVKYTEQETLIPGKAENIIEYFLLSNTVYNCSLLTLLIGFLLSILIEISLITFYFSNPFKAAYNTIYQLLLYLVIAFIFTEVLQYEVSKWWVNKSIHHLSGYVYNNYFDNIMAILIVPVTAIGLYSYHYVQKDIWNKANVVITQYEDLSVYSQ